VAVTQRAPAEEPHHEQPRTRRPDHTQTHQLHHGPGDESGSAQYLGQATEAAPKSWMLETTNEQLSKLHGYLASSPLKHLAV